MIFISSPFSSPLPAVQQARYERVMEFTSIMLGSGYQVFSPIVYCVPMAQRFNLPGDAAHWAKFNIEFLRQSEAMFLLQLPGWDQSKGVQMEMRLAKTLFIPVIHFNEDFEEVKHTIDGETLKVKK
jgi:hypothetical protein